MRWLDGITDSMDMGLGKLRELVIDRAPITIEPGGVGQVTYTITMNYPTVPEQ